MDTQTDDRLRRKVERALTRAQKDGDGQGKKKGTKQDKAIKDALDALDALPGLADNNELVPVPMPVTQDPPYSITVKDLRKATLKKIPVAALQAQQQTVDRSKVAKFIRQGKKTDGDPIISSVAGTNYVVDGHHRVTAALLLGMKKRRAIVMDIAPKATTDAP